MLLASTDNAISNAMTIDVIDFMSFKRVGEELDHKVSIPNKVSIDFDYELRF